MKKIMIVFLLTFCACIYDPPKPKIAIIKNISDTNLALIYGEDSVNDTKLFYGSKYLINARSTYVLHGSYPSPGKDNKMHFFFFDKDSVYKYINLNLQSGIVLKSFLKEYSIELDSVIKYDTIFFSGK